MKMNGRGYGAKSNTAKDGHHIIQDAAARTIPKYSYTGTPAIQLVHLLQKLDLNTILQRKFSLSQGGGTYAAKRRTGYKAIRKSGLKEEQAKYLFLMHVASLFQQPWGYINNTHANCSKQEMK
ncbi:hypothetical protein [Delftia lacustris]|jgi:hypothetical protein|nr:hypothetical protein [Delftia lacustris]BDE71663.1 hypothetical protein HQS1_27870 [Delftia lacustris]